MSQNGTTNRGEVTTSDKEEALVKSKQERRFLKDKIKKIYATVRDIFQKKDKIEAKAKAEIEKIFKESLNGKDVGDLVSRAMTIDQELAERRTSKRQDPSDLRTYRRLATLSQEWSSDLESFRQVARTLPTGDLEEMRTYVETALKDRLPHNSPAPIIEELD